MIVKEIPNVEILTLDNTLKSISSPGYTKLPQDTKNQNRNNYLDSIYGRNISDNILIDGNETILDNYTFTTVGNYKFDGGGGNINIPEGGTYYIMVNTYFNTNADDGEEELRINNNGVYLFGGSNSFISPTQYTRIEKTRIVNLNRGDILTVGLIFTSNDATMFTLEVTTEISIIKLS